MVPSRQSGVNCTIFSHLNSMEMDWAESCRGNCLTSKRCSFLAWEISMDKDVCAIKLMELSSTLIIEWVEFHTKGVELWSDRCIRRPRYHKLPMLKGLHLHTNSFEGELPENIGDLRYLRYLWLEWVPNAILLWNICMMNLFLISFLNCILQQIGTISLLALCHHQLLNWTTWNGCLLVRTYCSQAYQKILVT